MNWTDIYEIALYLYEHYPNVDPQYICFTDLHRYICQIPGFTGIPEDSNERILEAIQMAWINEVE